MKKYGKYIASFASALLFFTVGAAWETASPSNLFFIIFGVCAVLPVLLTGANILLAKQYIGKINNTKVADMQGYMLRHRAEAEKTAAVFLRKLQGIRRATTAYAVFLWLLAVCAALTAGMLLGEPWLALPCLIYAGVLFYAVYVRIRKEEPLTLGENDLVLKKEEYPTVYGIASRAANALGCRGDITVLTSFDFNASIARIHGKYYLILGATLLNAMSEKELYCICLHEFSHCSAKNEPSAREAKYSTWISSEQNIPRFLSFVSNCFIYFDVRYLFDHMTYSYATSVTKETEADRDMAKYGSPAVAASALLKLNYHDKFEWESGVYNEPSVFAAEAPDPHFITKEIEKFKNAMQSRHTEWDAMIDREILPNNASHPILRMRLETLGVKSPTCIADESTDAYRKEQKKALDFADEALFKMQDTYEQDRKEKYLDPLDRITQWKASGMPLSAETYADLVSDFRQIGMNEEAEALCERAMRELDANSSQHAYFIKGCALLHRYDETGAELVFHALESNLNYLEEGLEVIGDFYCMTGREKELTEYRERASRLAQKDKDEYSKTGYLAKDDDLSAECLPDGMLEEILAYIRSVGNESIQNVYLVRKTVNESFFTSAFVIRFDGGTDEERCEIMHRIFRYLDTYPVKWQFSLFDYAEYPQIKFDKIEGSLVYSKNGASATV